VLALHHHFLTIHSLHHTTLTGEIKTHTLDAKKSSYAWETKSIADRAHRKEQALIADFHANINPLDKLTADFKERMRVQLGEWCYFVVAVVVSCLCDVCGLLCCDMFVVSAELWSVHLSL